MPPQLRRSAAAPDHASQACQPDRTGSAERQLLTIYNDRIQTEQQLAAVYGKWSAQVLLQHRTLWHLILQSLASDRLHSHLHRSLRCPCAAADGQSGARPQADANPALRSAAGDTGVGGLLILLVIFGWPQANVHHSWPYHRRTHHRHAGFHPRVFRLVRPHGQEWHSRRRLG